MCSNPEQISLDKADEVRHWMRALRWSEEQLYSAVRQVGSGLEDLQRLRASAEPDLHFHLGDWSRRRH